VAAEPAVSLGLVAVAQTDLKQLMAAVISDQVRVLVLAAGVGGVVAGTSQLVPHAVLSGSACWACRR